MAMMTATPPASSDGWPNTYAELYTQNMQIRNLIVHGVPSQGIVNLLMVAIFAHAWGMLDPLNTQANSMQGSPP